MTNRYECRCGGTGQRDGVPRPTEPGDCPDCRGHGWLDEPPSIEPPGGSALWMIGALLLGIALTLAPLLADLL